MAQQDVKTSKLTRFNGGKSEDLRTQSQIAFSVTKHFDVFTNEHRLIPYRNLVADETFASGDKGDYEIAKLTYVNGRLFGYGKKGPNSAEASVFDKTAGGNTSFLNNDWEQKDSVSGNARIRTVFFAYKNSIYGFDTGGVWEYDTTNDTITSSDVSGIGSVGTSDVLADPVHHPADDIAYFFTKNKVHKNNAGSWSTNIIEVPSNLEITSACAFGNYLAIGCAPTDQYGQNSVVFLWDRNEAKTTFAEKIDWGSGRLEHLCVLDGQLTGVSSNSTDFATAGKASVDIRQGQRGTVVKSLDGEGSFAANGIVKDERLHFFMRFVDVNGEVQQGLWALTSQGDLTIDQYNPDIAENSTPPSVQGVYVTSNTWWLMHSGDGSIDRTDEDDNYTQTSVYESQIFTGEDSGETKEFIAAQVAHEPLPSGASVTLKFRTDENIGGSWTTLYTHSTQNSLEYMAVRDGNGNSLPQFKEIQFRIESDGGASITQLKWLTRPVPDNKL